MVTYTFFCNLGAIKRLSSLWFRLVFNNTVLQKKSGLSQKRDQPIMVVTYGLTKQESAGRFLWSIRMREIFQFEVWNSSNFVIIFLFIEKSMEKFEINTIDWCYIEEHLEFFFRIFRLYPALEMRFQVGKTWFGNVSFVQNAIKEILVNGIQRKLTR